MMILHKPHLLTKLEVWYPKYSTQYGDEGEKVVLLAKYKVDQSSPVIIIEFTKAKHLAGQRYCIKKEDCQRFELTNNGTIPCYTVPMIKLESWETAQEVREIAQNAFEN